ncbi:MAG: hypothetical protein VB051_08935 [Candidatus Pelethousia sp.]|nr:hypothetical protein [Candidatus Pelethousia sp.]
MKRINKKLLSLMLACVLVMALMPTPTVALADAPLLVNGVDITAKPDKTVVCGTGTAVYDDIALTLTLTNATIDTESNGTGIVVGRPFDNKVLTVKLIGSNVIEQKEGFHIFSGIHCGGTLSIEGPGSIAINTKEYSNAGPVGIFAGKGCNISASATVTISGEPADNPDAYSAGIYVDAGGMDVTCTNATIHISGHDYGFLVFSGDINIDQSNLTMSNLASNAIYTGGALSIDQSSLTMSSIASNAIYTGGALSITNGSKINATGYHPALFGNTAVIIENSEVEAVSTNDIGIFSRGAMSLTGGQIYAKGGIGSAAIAARAVKTVNEAAEAKITLSNLVEENGAKIAFGDWFLHSGGQTRSWTTFIAQDASAVVLNPSGGLANAVNEVWLSFNACSSGHDYSTEFTIDTLATCTADGSKSRHCLRCDAITDVTAIPATGHTESDWIVDKAATFTEEGSRHKECTVCKVVLKTEAIAKRSSTPSSDNDVIVDYGTGIGVEYENGSSFDSDIVLKVTPQSNAETNKLNNNINKVAKGLTLVGLYDIQLLKDGVAIQPSGKVKVSIPLTDEMKAMTDLKVVYIDDDGNATIIPSQIIDGKIVFVTEHFSYYGVIRSKNALVGVPKTGDDSSLGVWWVLLAVSGAAMVTLICTRKKALRP